MKENITEYIVRETSYQDATKQEVIMELVRCKDCMYYDESREGVAGFHRCSFFLRWEPTGGFCHYAIRRQITAESE